MTNIDRVQLCPCQSGKCYVDCCRPFHMQTAQPLTAEALMRSRYSAFALGNPSSAEPNIKQQMQEYLAKTQRQNDRPVEELNEAIIWDTLVIKGRKDGKKRHKTGMVHFVATYHFEQKPLQTFYHEEISFFEKTVSGQWLYTTGEQRA